MRRSWPIWIGFLFCLVVVLAAVSWISLAALRLDRAEAEARRQEAEAWRKAAWEERIRLALWRIDSALAPFVAQESVRPYFAYSSFLPLARAYGNMFRPRDSGEMLIPSPLLSENLPNIRVYFQFEPDGRLTSPQVPRDGNLRLAVPEHVSGASVERAQQQLARIESLVDRQKLLARLPEHTPEPVEAIISPLFQTVEQRQVQQRQRQLDLENYGRGTVEFNERNQVIRQNTDAMAQGQFAANALNSLLLPPTDVHGVVMTPLWIDGELLLARRITAGGNEYVQGCLLDWSAVKTSLLEMVGDLLPQADLKPVLAGSGDHVDGMLAALPVRLLPGKPTVDGLVGDPPSVSAANSRWPIRLSLAIAWSCMLLAAVAVGLLLWGVVRLSERRASFVSAVTHELRTPLTTFQMYAEMLAEGMVPDPQQQKHYLNTLRAEAARLGHLVENVLAYARLERGRADGRLETVALDRLIEQMEGRLAARAAQGGKELVVQSDHGSGAVRVRVNVSAAEQVLFNLVDNACKYAADVSDKRIHLMLGRNGNAAEVRLRDHGPGLSGTARRHLFCSFGKSAREAAHTAPGVGLGLALSRRLARNMGGDLQFDESVTGGACFVLTLALDR
ncbi:MAG: HAMP domain-containing histidine kinase [Pirellulales bacterium]|nr:HAMP domain-containing histidine kinase [Pirellulales bacterium]